MARSDTRAPTGTPLSRAMRPVNAVVERYIPSALVFAIVLTFVVGLMAVALTDSGPVDVVASWGEGLSGLLDFITQMALILLLGHMLAHTRPVQRLLKALGSLPRTTMQAYLFVFLVAAIASLITWGLGLVVAALIAREVAAQGRERGLQLHFPMLVAAGFSGFVVWHMGYSGSGPLLAATEGSFIADQLGAPIPVSETTYSAWNLIAIVVTLIAVAGALYLVAPRPGEKVREFVTDEPVTAPARTDEERTPADRVDGSRVLTTLLGLLLAGYLVHHYATGGSLTLDIVNWTFLCLILLLVANPFEMIALTRNAASNVGEILLQFPLYAGILGIMTASGLVEIISAWFVNISTPVTFGLLTFLSAGLVNLAIPSGGGQIAVQGPVMIDAANQIGVDPAIALMAIAYGDQWTNMIQPFFALPLLAIAGLKIRDILGYTTVTLVASGIVFGGTMLLISL
ncbi:TIGR00366 family protein [Pseudonocardia sp. NPDC046786]|uniref:short-chain fatty acid transporter n=1 Tax=Pseudonocardia sp. NPDC046786 TaxID=3155471 RepID=UPI0033FFBEDC